MTEPTPPQYNALLMCRLAAFDVDLMAHHTTLWFAAGNCCDMSGAIRFAHRLDPKVRKIITMSGELHDMTYERDHDSWGATRATTNRQQQLKGTGK